MKGNLAAAFASIFIFIAAAALLALTLASCKASPKAAASREMIADLDPIKTADITAQFKDFMGRTINPAQVAVLFAPRTDEALFQFKMDGYSYLLCLPREARELVREAAVRYNGDFDARRLNRDSSGKSERIYGRIEGCRMEWRLGSLAMSGEATPQMAAGYLFEMGSPYFAITVYSADNSLYKQGKSSVEKSVMYHIYMNKEQAEALAKELDEAALLRALNSAASPSFEPSRYGGSADAYSSVAIESEAN